MLINKSIGYEQLDIIPWLGDYCFSFVSIMIDDCVIVENGVLFFCCSFFFSLFVIPEINRKLILKINKNKK